MALLLNIEDITQSNDSSILKIVDGTGIYNAITNPNGWRDESLSSPNDTPKVSEIDGITMTLYLDIVLTTSNGSEIEYDRINLYDIFGPFTNVTDLTFNLNASMLITNGVVLGDDTTPLLDGWYTIVYGFEDISNTYADVYTNGSIFIDGNIRKKVYDKLREVPYSNTWSLLNKDYNEWSTIIYPLYFYSLFTGMLSELSAARKTAVLNILSTLERLTK
jgi:hypothetical protein